MNGNLNCHNGERREPDSMMQLSIIRLCIIISLALILFNYYSPAQEYAEKPYDSRAGYGVQLYLDYNQHTGNFKGLPGIPSCCPRYQTGTGLGLNPVFFYLMPLQGKWELSIGAGLNVLSAKLTSTEPVYLAGPPPDYIPGVNGTFEYTIDASIWSVGLTPQIIYRLTDQLSVQGGIRANFLMIKTFSQKEEVLTNYGYFPDTKTRTRYVYDNQPIPDASALDLGLTVGANYRFPLNSSYTLFLVPGASYSFGITPIASGLNWHATSLNGGVSILYAPREIIPPIAPPAPPPPPLPPPPPEEVPLLTANISAVSVDRDGKESPVNNVVVEEFASTRYQPFLRNVYFDSNSSAIPARYKKMLPDIKEKFKNDDKALFNLSTLDVYYQLLNIIGKRMLKNPSIILTLTGCNSDEGIEKNNLGISQRRADRVKTFLTTEWGIDPARIITKARNLPELPSNPTDPDGMADNRRVEFDANFPQLFDPIKVEELTRRTNPPIIRFKPDVKTEVGIANWQIITSQKDGELKIFSGGKTIPPQVDWVLEREEEYIPKFDEPLVYKLEITDNDNKVWESKSQELPVSQITMKKKMEDLTLADKEISKFSFISFDFNSSDLTREHKSMVELVKKVMKKNSTVRIEGYTDRTGDPTRNKSLSERRALSVSRALGLSQNVAKGLGPTLIFDNDLPEGRFFNRTVIVTVETPVELK